MKNNYWNIEEDELMRIVLTKDSSTKEWIMAYNAIIPKLRYMGRNILGRYFNKMTNDESIENDLVTDAITKLIVTGTYNPDKPKLYAYCGTAIKRYFTDELLRKHKWGNNKIYNQSLSIDEEDWLIEVIEVDDNDYDFEIRQERLEIIIKYLTSNLNQIKNKKNKSNKKKRNKYSRELSAKTFIDREIEFLTLCIEYFNKFFLLSNVSPLGIIEYLYENSSEDTPPSSHTYYLRKYFNINSNLSKIINDNYLVNMVDKLNTTYIQDDFTPEDNDYVKNAKRHKFNNKYNYF